jgi:polyhydroxyalkanoate synthesis regulator phasin
LVIINRGLVMTDNETRAKPTGLVGACVATALLDTLHSKGILSLDEAREVLKEAMRQVGINSQAPEAYSATGMIANMLSGPYTARR